MENLYFWRYAANTRNYPGYHLSLDAKAAEAITNRLRSRLAMRMDRPVKFKLKQPDQLVLSVPNNRRHKAITKGSVQIAINFDKAADQLHIAEAGDQIKVEFSEDKARELLEGISRLLVGENDYAMLGKDEENNTQHIWFW